MKPNVRAARTADLETLYRMDQACFPEDISFSLAELNRYLVSPRAAVYVAEIAGSTIGFSIVATEEEADTGTLITLDVLPGFRRSGIGSSLVRASERWLREKGVLRFRLQVDVSNDGALAFYSRFGFRKTRLLRDYYGRGKNAYLMQKTTDVA